MFAHVLPCWFFRADLFPVLLFPALRFLFSFSARFSVSSYSPLTERRRTENGLFCVRLIISISKNTEAENGQILPRWRRAKDRPRTDREQTENRPRTDRADGADQRNRQTTRTDGTDPKQITAGADGTDGPGRRCGRCAELEQITADGADHEQDRPQTERTDGTDGKACRASSCWSVRPCFFCCPVLLYFRGLERE